MAYVKITGTITDIATIRLQEVYTVHTDLASSPGATAYLYAVRTAYAWLHPS